MKVRGAKEVPLDPPSYPKPGKHTGGINDMVLLYNGWYEGGKGDLSKDDIMPYILYSDASGWNDVINGSKES